MKTLTLIISLSFCIFSQAQSTHLDKRKSLYSHARNGLSLRTSPDLNGEKDTLISYGDEVKLVSMLDTVFSINGLSGSWYKVEYFGRQGFVFSAFLSTCQVKVKTGKHIYLKDFAFENLKQTDGDKNFEMSDDQNKSIEAIFGNNRYTCAPGGYCDLDEKLYIEGMEIQEAFIVFAAYLMDYNEYNFDSKQFKNNKVEDEYQYHYSLEIHDGYNQEIYISYSLDERNSYRSMSVSFDWEGGGGTLSVSKWNESLICIAHSYYCH